MSAVSEIFVKKDKFFNKTLGNKFFRKHFLNQNLKIQLQK